MRATSVYVIPKKLGLLCGEDVLNNIFYIHFYSCRHTLDEPER